jgi:hypothetical protein
MALVSENILGKRPLGRLKSAPEDNIKMDFKDHEDLRLIFSIKYNIKGMRIRITLTESTSTLDQRAKKNCCYMYKSRWIL